MVQGEDLQNDLHRRRFSACLEFRVEDGSHVRLRTDKLPLIQVAQLLITKAKYDAEEDRVTPTASRNASSKGPSVSCEHPADRKYQGLSYNYSSLYNGDGHPAANPWTSSP